MAENGVKSISELIGRASEWHRIKTTKSKEIPSFIRNSAEIIALDAVDVILPVGMAVIRH